MDARELRALIEATAAVVEGWQRRGEQLEHAHRALLERIPSLVSEAAAVSLQSVPAQLQQKAAAALDHPMRECDRQLASWSARVRTLAEQIDRLERLHRHLVWKSLGATTAALLAVIAGGTALSHYYYLQVRNDRIRAELLRLYNTADVVPCGEGRLCANVEAGPGYGDGKQYRPIRPRP